MSLILIETVLRVITFKKYFHKTMDNLPDKTEKIKGC